MHISLPELMLSLYSRDYNIDWAFDKSKDSIPHGIKIHIRSGNDTGNVWLTNSLYIRLFRSISKRSSVTLPNVHW